MILAANQTAFDALYPFSFTTDGDGTIRAIGCSLAKLCPQAHVGQRFLEHFRIFQPNNGKILAEPKALTADLIVLEHVSNPERKFRGHVVLTDTDSSTYIFALKPVITALADIPLLGLTIADFEFGDPNFDFLLYMQGQLSSQKNLREAKATLEWENRVSKLLLTIATATESSDSKQEVYRTTLASVCGTLNWEFGHVYVVSDTDKDRLISGCVCENRAPLNFRSFEEASRSLSFTLGEGLPGRVLEQREVVWVKNIREMLSFPRREAIKEIPNLTGVGLPVFVGHEIVAVVEFFTERVIVDSENMRRFFKLLSNQLGGTIARQRAEHAARQHLAELALTSKLATLGEMAAGIAHEINNPLHTLALTSHLLKRLLEAKRLSEDVLMSQIQKIEGAIQRMSSIVGALKTFSRDSSHDSFQCVSLKRLIQETLELSNATLSQGNVHVELSEMSDTCMVECRPSQVSQVLLNLLNNAYDAIKDHDQRWIRVDVTEREDSYDIAVSDSGPKIPPEVAMKLITPFFTTKPPGKGTGLGLSISRNIMTNHRGDLTLDQSAPHTRFVATLPKRHVADSLHEALPEHTPPLNHLDIKRGSDESITSKGN